ncbi:MAG: hypothetical protein V4662_24940 [Verrucomicrobiota bacterium]
MSQNKNASGFPTATATALASFLTRIAGRWVNIPAALVQPTHLVTSDKTANYTVLAAETGTTFTNYGAIATITFALPPAVVGLHYRFVVLASSGTSWQLRVDPNGTETIGAGTSGQYQWADALREVLHIACFETGKWVILNAQGTWTAA